ncbi:hypothetical protein CCHL11_08885 [Colletotrichum chlorophyti]|uniref:Uncharacterized protein n=1 Tax=Colletotrichum chlorophyti TaxID=708187 RepID=A0A1Q8RBR7_9PEZI|nr:hypothetical protein CCHL11_08885 [Colletotrichum chlorophyti]
MTASAIHSHLQHSAASDCYDPDDVLPRDSPQMQPHRPRLLPSPSPPPALNYGPKATHGRRKVEPIQGDAVLVAHLGNGRQPHVAQFAALEPLGLASDNGSDEESASSTSPDREMNKLPGPLDLKILAADALAFTATGDSEAPTAALVPVASTAKSDHARIGDETRIQHATLPTGLGMRELPIRDERPALAAPAVVYPAEDKFPSRQPAVSLSKVEVTSPVSPAQSAPGGLPPLLDSPKSDGSGHGPLPSIRAQLGDFKRLAGSALSPEADLGPPTPAAVARGTASWSHFASDISK